MYCVIIATMSPAVVYPSFNRIRMQAAPMHLYNVKLHTECD